MDESKSVEEHGLPTTQLTVEEHRQYVNQVVADVRALTDEIVNTVKASIGGSPIAVSTLTDALSDACLLVDVYGTVIGANLKARNIFGHVVVGEALAEAVHRLNKMQDVGIKEWVLYVPDQHPMYFDVTISKMAAGDVYILHNITDRRKLELKALDINSFQQNIVRSAPTLLFYTDVFGAQIRGSNMFFEYIGWTRLTGMTKTVKDLFDSGSVLEQFIDPTTELLVKKVRTVKGDTVWLRRRAITDHSDEVQGFVATLEVITT